MGSLRRHLLKKNYVRIPLKSVGTGHLKFDARINGVAGEFILDTGASNTCIGFEDLEHFKLFAEDSDIKAAGAGAIDMLTQLSQNNQIEIGDWSTNKASIVLFDLSHINTALTNHDAEPVSGIIGADILNQGDAVIDYQYECFYLKKK
ncbi:MULTISPECIES: TIGR02281 family clan AA aspartic protease [unclassified Leeuwenhoekiella]|uniref:retropepsin-like aspartic protease family protein n=1 Tax=unclassified Leeuwenhoekiella TaxID=2615029 RepID=UPI000C39543C|nr:MULTISPECIES: retropepsin-like aspartic protease [unclassified Leeuwenhoekiella]MAW96337.1 acid protease [Leeuwenhoekiella sp.]MBA81224.1 acid protease [Leeuwenhoekiella sp.]|tara:strand:+ start:3206 stop:3649 length:444 start_codon:yes stop_codon:yes gene_type:complete